MSLLFKLNVDTYDQNSTYTRHGNWDGVPVGIDAERAML